MTNETNKVLHTGVTSDLTRRAWEQRETLIRSFTARYNVVKLVYYEVFRAPPPHG